MKIEFTRVNGAYGVFFGFLLASVPGPRIPSFSAIHEHPRACVWHAHPPPVVSAHLGASLPRDQT